MKKNNAKNENKYSIDSFVFMVELAQCMATVCVRMAHIILMKTSKHEMNKHTFDWLPVVLKITQTKLVWNEQWADEFRRAIDTKAIPVENIPCSIGRLNRNSKMFEHIHRLQRHTHSGIWKFPIRIWLIYANVIWIYRFFGLERCFGWMAARIRRRKNKMRWHFWLIVFVCVCDGSFIMSKQLLPHFTSMTCTHRHFSHPLSLFCSVAHRLYGIQRDQK